MMKRILPLLLALVLLVSALTVGVSAYAPLMQGVDGYLELDLGMTLAYPDANEKLKTCSVATFLQWLKAQNGDNFDNTDITYVAWTREQDGDNFTVVDAQNGTIDLSDDGVYYQQIVEIVVGNGRQLGADNRRYRVNLYHHLVNEITKASLSYQQDGDTTWTEPEYVYDATMYENSHSAEWHQVSYVLGENVAGAARFRLQFQTAVPLESLSVYLGFFPSVEKAEEVGAVLDTKYSEATATGESIINAAYEDECWLNLCFVYVLDGEKCFKNIGFLIYKSEGRIHTNGLLDADGQPVESADSTRRSDDLWLATFKLYRSLPVDGTYYLRMRYHTPTGEWGTVEDIASAYVDGDTSTNIKDALFGDTGYPADYSGEGHRFVITDKYGHRENWQVVTTAGEYEPSDSTYFSVYSARVGESESEYASLRMPQDTDSLYQSSNGSSYQTVLLKPDIPLDMSTLKPTFWVHQNGTAFARSVGATAAVEQTSGESVVDFTNPPVLYTVRSASGAAIQNYWVTFMQKQDGKQLFVNGPGFDTPQVVEELAETDKREVLLSGADDHHDIFIANLGAEALGNLRVTLDADAQKTLKLDDFWTVASGDSLSGFASTYINNAWNVAKLRLRLADAPANLETNEISGCLTIESDGGTRYVYLTGTIAPSIVTSDVPDAVKYVPYSVMVQTNNHSDSNTVTYSVTDGALPTGISLNPHTGEIYGVPTQVGTYDFEVTASFSSENFTDSVQAYQIVVSDNTDANVDAENDYTIIDRVEDIHETDDYTDQLFHIDHAFSEFEKFFLDGRLLTNGVDYDAEEGSTKITVRAQTFRTAGPGRHTISAEFRTSDNVMTKAAQNYTSNVPTSSGSSSSGKANKATKPAETPDNGPFVDVLPSDWFYSNVMWAYEQGHMTGVSSSRFAPNQNTTQAMVVVVLARVAGVDLTKYAGESESLWYTAAANWAAEEGLIDPETFAPNAPIERGALAVMLLKFFDRQKITYTTPTAAEKVAFLDAGEMTADEENAFQCLRRAGIFYGNGKNDMRPASATTRAHLAALLQRITGYMDAHKA